MRLSYLFVLIFFISCNNSGEMKSSNQFFQMREYFNKQAVALQKKNIPLHKRINRDGKEESKIIDSLEWKNEFRPFIDCDLNKPAWKKSYKTDTIISADQTQLIYSALEPKLSVRKLEVTLRGDTVFMVDINLEKKNAYYFSSQQLHYDPWKGYTIIGSQKVILANPTTFIIKASFN